MAEDKEDIAVRIGYMNITVNKKDTSEEIKEKFRMKYPENAEFFKKRLTKKGQDKLWQRVKNLILRKKS